jgi:hypothetical protein
MRSTSLSLITLICAHSRRGPLLGRRVSPDLSDAPQAGGLPLRAGAAGLWYVRRGSLARDLLRRDTREIEQRRYDAEHVSECVGGVMYHY